MEMNNDGSSNTSAIGNVLISDECVNDQVFLILDNRGKNTESIHISYEEFNSTGKKLLENFDLSNQTPKKVVLPKGFDSWTKLYIKVGKKELPISQASLTSLKNLLNKTKSVATFEPSQPEIEIPTFKPEQSTNSFLEVDKENINKLNDTSTEQIKQTLDTVIDYQDEAEKIVRSTQEQVVNLADAYKNGRPIDLSELEASTPSQKVLLFLNAMGRDLSKWITELEQSNEVNRNLIDTLKYREEDIKQELKAIRCETSPVPKPLELETDINTDSELDEIRKECNFYIKWFEGRLFGYEERGEINTLEKYDQIIPQFIKDKLFNGIARFVAFDQMPKQMDAFLALIGYKIVPIEIGKTKVDARVHDIQDSEKTSVEPGTIVEVVLPGLQRIEDGEIIQKPIVIRGE